MRDVQEAIASLGKVDDMDLDEVETADKKKDKKKKRKAEESAPVADAATNGAAVQGESSPNAPTNYVYAYTKGWFPELAVWHALYS